MKLYTYKDVYSRYVDEPSYIDVGPTGYWDQHLLHAPLAWQERGLQQTASGYGRKLTTEWKIHYASSPLTVGRLYRIYATCFSNVASHWFMCKGQKIFIQ